MRYLLCDKLLRIQHELYREIMKLRNKSEFVVN